MKIISVTVMEQPGHADIIWIDSGETHFDCDDNQPLIFESRTRKGDGIDLVNRIFPEHKIKSECVYGNSKKTVFT